MTIHITRDIAIEEYEIEEDFIRASGPGGQHVNKVATAVQLRFDVGHSSSLSDEIRRRLTSLAGRRITRDGILIIEARRFRSQERNRRDAMDRLIQLLQKAAERPKLRSKTNPSPASKKRRLEEKRRQRQRKHLRKPVSHDEE